ncbi:MAG: Ig-like domain-containing protein, partial [Acidimicrobiales bacterium]|nr:Ig-like domain-containing protein [Acidimicrobiales bacterium]
AVPDRAEVRPGESVRVDVLANDSDPDSDPIELVPAELGKPGRGTVKIDGAAVVFEAPSGATPGEVSFDYTIVDSRGASARAVATVAITTDPAPVPPIARDDTVSPQVAGATVTVDVLENDEDPDGDIRRLDVRVDGQAGVDVVDRRLRFTMADRAMNFAYEITDSQKLSARAFVQVPLAAEADLPPVAAVDRAETEFNQAVKLSVLENDRDPEGKPLSLTKVVGTPRNGTAEIQGSQVLFSPQKDFAGEGGFSYEVSDGKNVAQGSAVVVVKAQGNRPPKFTALVVEIPAGGKREVNLTNAVTDPDAGDKHTFANARSDRDTVSASLNGTTLSVTASAQAKGAEARVTVDVSDGKPDGTAQGVVTVKVLASDKPLPSAVKDTVTTKEDAPVTVAVLANDVDPQGLGLRLDSVTAGTGGTPVVQGDQVVFTPAKGFFGQASFTYTLFDKTGDAERTAKGTVDVTVIGRPSAPPAPTGTVRSKGVTLQWAVPSANGAPITSYRIQTDAGAAQRCNAISETSCSIDGLTNGTTYRFQVQAVNEAGDSPWSPPSADLTPDVLPGTPAAPTGRFGDRAVTVTWAPPSNEGTALSEYTLEVSPPPPSGAGSQTLGGGTTSYVWQ